MFYVIYDVLLAVPSLLIKSAFLRYSCRHLYSAEILPHRSGHNQQCRESGWPHLLPSHSILQHGTWLSIRLHGHRWHVHAPCGVLRCLWSLQEPSLRRRRRPPGEIHTLRPSSYCAEQFIHASSQATRKCASFSLSSRTEQLKLLVRSLRWADEQDSTSPSRISRMVKKKPPDAGYEKHDPSNTHNHIPCTTIQCGICTHQNAMRRFGVMQH